MGISNRLEYIIICIFANESSVIAITVLSNIFLKENIVLLIVLSL